MEPPSSTKSSPAFALNEAVTPYRVAQSPAPDLEFPDWSGQLRPAPTATMEDMHRLSLSLMKQRTLPPDFDERRLKAKVAVEFHL